MRTFLRSLVRDPAKRKAAWIIGGVMTVFFVVGCIELQSVDVEENGTFQSFLIASSMLVLSLVAWFIYTLVACAVIQRHRDSGRS
jgi:hypothetical protein